MGASIGAVTGAILAGNPPERRLERLKAFWAEATLHTVGAAPADLKGRQVHNGTHVALTALLGRPSIFGHRYPGLWSLIPGVPSDVALYDHAPLRRTLERLVDFDRLNRAETRFAIACTNIETGDDIYFDNTRHEIGPEHILASAALAPLFPPVEIDGRLLCDPGYANNLPLDPVFEEAPERDLVCVAIDLFSLRSPRPASLDAVLERAQDIIFASAGRRRIEALRREYALHEELRPAGARVRLVHSGLPGGAPRAGGQDSRLLAVVAPGPLDRRAARHGDRVGLAQEARRQSRTAAVRLLGGRSIPGRCGGKRGCDDGMPAGPG